MGIDGDTLAPPIAVSFMQYYKQANDISVISLYVFQKRGQLKFDKPLYTKVLSHTHDYSLKKK